jgi:hypothetical protein
MILGNQSFIGLYFRKWKHHYLEISSEIIGIKPRQKIFTTSINYKEFIELILCAKTWRTHKEAGDNNYITMLPDASSMI